jgi:predicted DNA-binding protein with PD1-like motif
MKYSTATQGRVFVLRLEQGEVLHEVVEQFAADHGIGAGTVIAVGGAESGSMLVVGPEDGAARPVNPVKRAIDGVHEIAGVGTLFPDESRKPVLHMHAAFGRQGCAVAGCVRAGVVTWVVLEVVITELLECSAVRRKDSDTGFALLDP